ncbi:hypothetical protein WN55_08623 [Dufourea novaeangliae]|uniref:Uncharacterized protein n=1 Tax=Dufourea novaeangliae TaxID=178035 RepID=A0A154PSZ6_DUFNO|nr:hypothetical protein WN55_08623 [Dufourea novaeangliae]
MDTVSGKREIENRRNMEDKKEIGKTGEAAIKRGRRKHWGKNLRKEPKTWDLCSGRHHMEKRKTREEWKHRKGGESE